MKVLRAKMCFALLALLAAAVLLAVPAAAQAPSGAIFTTLSDGSEVNTNLFPSKDAVYLDGGPGPGAPQTAAGLDDGTYVFQITDPSGKTLLSTDPGRCRQFVVSGGIITSVVAQFDNCQHKTGLDIDHNATTVQMMPYNDTPNNGGVYKAWATPVANYIQGCDLLGVATGNELNVVDCGFIPGAAVHGFIPAHSKTDNFKVKTKITREIDTTFLDENGIPLSGFGETWSDTLGASNNKWSYFQPNFGATIAHIEAIEDGTHYIRIDNQVGCTINWVDANGQSIGGPQTVAITVPKSNKDLSIYIGVHCITK